MIGEPLWKTLLFWLPRKYLPYRIRRWFGILNLSEYINQHYFQPLADAFEVGIQKGLIEAGDDWFLREVQRRQVEMVALGMSSAEIRDAIGILCRTALEEGESVEMAIERVDRYIMAVKLNAIRGGI